MLKYDGDVGFLDPDWQDADEWSQIAAVRAFHRSAGEVAGDSDVAHAAFHTVVERQLVDPEIPETARAVERLLMDGWSRHEAIHRVGRVLGGVLYAAAKDALSEDANELLRRQLGLIADRGTTGDFDFRAPIFGAPDDEEGLNLGETPRPDAWSEGEVEGWVGTLGQHFAESPEGREVGVCGWAEAVVAGLVGWGLHPAEIDDGAEALEHVMHSSIDLQCEPADAGAIVAELEAFFRFAARAFDWPVGDEAAEALRGDLTVRRLAKAIAQSPDLEALEGAIEAQGIDMSDTDQVVDYLARSAAADAFGGPSAPVVPFRRETPKVGRNDPCSCGSGKKYKRCCGR